MRFSRNFIWLVKWVIPIETVIQDEGVELFQKGQNLMAFCPFHKEKTPSFQVIVEKQFFHCFGCGVGGDVIVFIQNSKGLSFLDAIEYLAQKYKIPLPKNKKRRPQKQKRSPHIHQEEQGS